MINLSTQTGGKCPGCKIAKTPVALDQCNKTTKYRSPENKAILTRAGCYALTDFATRDC